MRNRPYKAEAIVFPATTCTNHTYILIDDYYYVSDYRVSGDVAKPEIDKRYLTKSFAYVEGTTQILLSDGRKFFHPNPVNHDTKVFSYDDCTFIPIDKFDEMIENIPLAGTYDEIGN